MIADEEILQGAANVAMVRGNGKTHEITRSDKAIIIVRDMREARRLWELDPNLQGRVTSIYDLDRLRGIKTPVLFDTDVVGQIAEIGLGYISKCQRLEAKLSRIKALLDER